MLSQGQLGAGERVGRMVASVFGGCGGPSRQVDPWT